jgi:hypothetical protein
MNSYTLPRPTLRTIKIRVPAAAHDAAWIEGRAMKIVGWTATILVIGTLAWLAASADVAWLRGLSGLLLLAMGMLIGLRFGAQSASAYIRDLQRLNKTLCDQQQELEGANQALLNQAAESLGRQTSSKSA